VRTIKLEIPTAEVFEPLLAPARYKGAKGGRSAGLSHFFAALLVEEMVTDPQLRAVCIREVQRSLKFSAKALVEKKIRDLGVSDLFDVLQTEIRRKHGTGVMIFEGMQDHTADSIKSLEGFGRAWVEEAQSLSARSLELLIPTIRAPGSELWFSWNPEQATDPVDAFFGGGDHAKVPDNASLVHSTWQENPWCPDTMRDEALRMQRVDPEAYAHVWGGGYNVKSEAQVLAGKWRVDEFEPAPHWDGPYFGADWGYSQDPTVLVRCWIGDGRLWVDYEVGGVGIGMDDIPKTFLSLPGADRHRIRADAANPQVIAYLAERGMNIEAAAKWPGSVEDGILYLRKFEEVVIHQRCRGAIEEARMWRWKTDRLTGDPLPKLVDAYNHRWDAVRYALSPLIRPGKQAFIYST
jgi:phage terminase large subunit